MAKKRYTSAWMDLDTEDPTIIIGPSQGTSGYDSRYSFEGIDEDNMAMIDLNCDDFDLQDMDTDENYVITLAEFEAWLEARGGW